jgi:hypothetical protein
MEATLIRITIQDGQQTISFPSDEETLLRLVAGCSVNPTSLAELLIASDIYQRGIAAAIMAELMEFDKTLRREGPEFIHALISQAQGQPLELTFQVFDEVTGRVASQPLASELVLIDLIHQTIRASAGVHIPSAGEVRIRAGDTVRNPKVTYILPQNWTVQPL